MLNKENPDNTFEGFDDIFIAANKFVKYYSKPENFIKNYKFLKACGIDEDLKVVAGLRYNPLNDFELLKERRLEIYKEEVHNFITEIKENNSVVCDMDLLLFYESWLKNELSFIDLVFSGKQPKINEIRVKQYHQFVIAEIKNIEYQINQQVSQSEQKTNLKSDCNEIKNINMNPTEIYYNQYFNIIAKEGYYISIYDFHTTINHATQNLKTEIIANLENKDSDTARLFYIKRIKNKFNEFIPSDNNIDNYFFNYKKLCDSWCKEYECNNNPQLFQNYNSELSGIFEAKPNDINNHLFFDSNDKNIRNDFFDFIRFGAMKEIFDNLCLHENFINKPALSQLFSNDSCQIEFFNKIDSVYYFLHTISPSIFYINLSDILNRFKKEIFDNLDKKEKDSSKIIYIDKIKNNFQKYSSKEHNIDNVYDYHCSRANNWCAFFNSEIIFPEIMLLGDTVLNDILKSNPSDSDKVSDLILPPENSFNYNISNAEYDFYKIISDFNSCIIFYSIKSINDFLNELQEKIYPPIINNVTHNIEYLHSNYLSYNTEKTLKFINIQFKSQISENSLTRSHFIHANYLFLNFDNSRNEIIACNKDNNTATLNVLYTLANENIELYNSTIKHFTGDELGFKALNFLKNEMENIKYNNLEQLYKLRGDEIIYVSGNNFDSSPLQADETEYRFFNEDLYEYSYKILNFINKIHLEIFNQKKHDTMFEEKIESYFLSDMYYSRMLYDSFKKDHNLLTTYIEVEAKKANVNFIEPEIFFKRCHETIIKFFNLVKIKINDRKSEINFRMQRALNKETFLPHDDSDLTIEQKFEKEIAYCKNELEVIDIVKFSADIRGMTKREFDSHLKYNEIQFIKNAIDEAYRIFINNNSKSDNTFNNDKLTGFQCNLEIEKIEKIYNELKGSFIDSSLENFKAIFSNDSLPVNFIKIKWKLLNRNKKPHKTALREFLTLFFDECPSQKQIDNCISDIKDNPIKLAKPKANEYSNYYEVFEKILV
jgi:hypothetical protein